MEAMEGVIFLEMSVVGRGLTTKSFAADFLGSDINAIRYRIACRNYLLVRKKINDVKFCNTDFELLFDNYQLS